MSFPTSDHPMSDTTMKSMLRSLRTSLQADLFSYVHKIFAKVQDIGDKLDHVENKVEELTNMFNTIIDAHRDQRDDIAWLKNKIADLEEKSCRNNLKICSVPEAVTSSQLPHFV